MWSGKRPERSLRVSVLHPKNKKNYDRSVAPQALRGTKRDGEIAKLR